MKKRHVAVLMGGISSEHEVSLKSGAMVLQNLNDRKYRKTPLTIGRDGNWTFGDDPPVPIWDAVARLKTLKVDCIFIALHGPFGEDGRLQGMFDLLRIPYVGSGCAASALAMDKVRSKAVVRQAGVRVPKDLVFDRAEWEADPNGVVGRIKAEVGFPCVPKSPCQGSSIGMAIVPDVHELKSALPSIFGFDDVVLVEQFISGPEVTCAVLDVEPGKPPRPLPVTEIRPVSSDFFDYYAKYTPGACTEITPAEISEAAARKVQDAAVRVHTAVGCEGLSRSDMILDGDEPVWFEVNTIPGMTETSLYPQAAAAAGIAFSKLLGMFIEAAIESAKSRG